MNTLASAPPLDERQRDAVSAGGGLVRVTAGAGTGKTSVLSERIVRLVGEGEQPSSILATTFTNKAVSEMRHRLMSRLGEQGGMVQVRTIDSAALRLCLRHPVEAGFRPGFLLADDDELLEVNKEAAAAVGLVYDGMEQKERKEILKQLHRMVSSWKAGGLLPEQAPMDNEWVQAWKLIEASMRARNLVGFSDLVLGANAALGVPSVLKRESGLVRWLLVDEFQDTNPAQFAFLHALSSVHRNLFIVGDPDQGIYSFRKSCTDAMEKSTSVMAIPFSKGFTSVELVTNRRCTDEVLRPACLLVGYNPRPDPKVLQSGRAGAPVLVEAHATATLEAEAVSREVRALHASGVRFSDIAVLARTSRALDEVSSAMPVMNIPFSIRGGNRFPDRSEVRDVMSYIKLSVNPLHDLALHRIMSRPARGLGPNVSSAAITISRAEGVTLHEALAKLAPSLRREASDAAMRMSAHLRALASMSASGRPPADLVEYVLGQVGYSEWAHSLKGTPQSLGTTLTTILRISEQHSSVHEFVMDAMLDPDVTPDDDDSVSLSTIHASKGLEWPHVFVVGLEDGLFPSARALNDTGNPDDPWDWRASGGMDEERRLLHVAMTRSMSTLRLSYAVSRGYVQSARPSRMLREAELRVPRPAARIAPSVSPRGPGVSKKASRQQFW